MTQAAPSLRDFAGIAPARKQGQRCAVCQLDRVDEINAAIRDGVPPKVIWRWVYQELRRTEITHRMVSYHRDNLHHQGG